MGARAVACALWLAALAAAAEVGPSCAAAFTDGGAVNASADVAAVADLVAYAHERCRFKAVNGCCFIYAPFPDGFDNCRVQMRERERWVCDTDGDPCYKVSDVVVLSGGPCCNSPSPLVRRGAYVAFPLSALGPFSRVWLRLTPACPAGAVLCAPTAAKLLVGACEPLPCDALAGASCSAPAALVSTDGTGRTFVVDVTSLMRSALAEGKAELALRLTASAPTLYSRWPQVALCAGANPGEGECEPVGSAPSTGLRLRSADRPEERPALVVERGCSRESDCSPSGIADCVVQSKGAEPQCGECEAHEGAPCRDKVGGDGYCCGPRCVRIALDWRDPDGDGRPSSDSCGLPGCEGVVQCKGGVWACSSEGRACCDGSSVYACTGSGECRGTAPAKVCTPFGCSGGACAASCSSAGDCAEGHACIASSCRRRCRTSLECPEGSCVDTDRDGLPDACLPCGSGGEACLTLAGQRGHCCSGACQVPPFPVPEGALALSSEVRCGGGPCAGHATCATSWVCDSARRPCCERGSRGSCSASGSCEASEPCAPYRCSGPSCASSCTSDENCTTRCCAAGSCSPFGAAAEGGACASDCECASGLCDRGVCRSARACERASDCPGGLCVAGACRDSCGPDGAACSSSRGEGLCCAGACQSAPGEPGSPCGQGGCSGLVACRERWSCSTEAAPCCDGGSAGTCAANGTCVRRELCADRCLGGLRLVLGCASGSCAVVREEECAGRCTPQGCVECLADADCSARAGCSGHVHASYACAGSSCVLEPRDCARSGRLCMREGCAACTDHASCVAAYGASFACDVATGSCRAAQCREDPDCPGACEGTTFVPSSCRSLACVPGAPRPCEAGEVCGPRGCAPCASYADCALAYGLEWSCVGGRCAKLCGDGICDGAERCLGCPQDCACESELMCDPLSPLADALGCVGDADGDGSVDSRDPRPSDPDNACTEDRDCRAACYRNTLHQHRCVAGRCSLVGKASCDDGRLVCDAAAARCEACQDGEPCRVLLGPSGVCSQGRCLQDVDGDGAPDELDPCPRDRLDACSVRCGDGRCDPGEDCAACLTDCGCDDGDGCTDDACDRAARRCRHRFRPCGAACGEGEVCDGRGGCSAPRGEGEACGCSGACQRGFLCDGGSCLAAACGDGACENECGVCPEDCPPAECRSDGSCDPGEDCRTSADCACPAGWACSPGLPNATAAGCAETRCGDGRCDGAEDADSCCLDCPCPGGMECSGGRCTGGCGDGSCRPEECPYCGEDCSPAQCRNGACEPAVGESCRTSADCSCSASVNVTSHLSLEEGGRHPLVIQVRNDGSLRDRFTVEVESGLGTDWTRVETGELEPNASQFLTLQVAAPPGGGRGEVVVRIRSKADPSRESRRTVSVESASKGWLARLVEGTPLGTVLELKDIAELLIIAGSVAGALLLALRTRAARRATAQAPTYTQGSIYQQRYYGPYYR